MPSKKAEKFVYRNISPVEIVIVGVGKVASGSTIESDVELNNPSLELVDGKKLVGVDPVTKVKKEKN